MWQEALQLSGGGGSSTPFQFSTEEQKTNMKWIDGKDIYCKSYDKTSTSNIANGTVLDSTLKIGYVDTLIGIEGFANSNNDAYLPLNWAQNGSYDYCAYIRVRNNGLLFESQNLTAIKRVAVTVYYTKK